MENLYFNLFSKILFHLIGGTIDIAVHEILEDGRFRELYKATGGPWGGNDVDEAFVKYFCDIFSNEVVKAIEQDYPSEFVDMMHDFEQVKREISLEDQDEMVRLTIPYCVGEVYLKIKNVNVQNAFKDDRADKTKGAYLENNTKLYIPRIVVSKMIKQVAECISVQTTFLLDNEIKEELDFIIMVGGFSNPKIVVEEIRNKVKPIPLIVIEDPELSVVRGAVIFGWQPQLFKSRKSKRTYGIEMRSNFRENVDPERLMIYDDTMMICVKKCEKRFDKLITINEEVDVDQIVKRSYFPIIHSQNSMVISIYESKESNVSYIDEPGTRKLGTIEVPMTDLTGDKKRKVEIEVRFGGTEFFVSCKDVTTGVVVSDKYDFL